MKKFRIAFVGNVNCMPFSYAQEIKRLGHEVVFFISNTRTEKLHRPEFRFSYISYPYEDWIKEIDTPKRDMEFIFPSGSLAKLISHLKAGDYDAVVLNGTWHKLANHFKESDHIQVVSLFSGADIDVMADYNNVISSLFLSSRFIDLLKVPIRLLEVWFHRRGIRRASLVNYYPEGVSLVGDMLITQIMRGKSFYRLQIRGMVTELVNYCPASNRTGADVVVFNLARFLWKEPLPKGYTSAENKRNDIMLKGIAEYYKKTGVPIKVILIEKGAQLEETKALIDDLSISHLISWHKEMTFQEILHFYEMSDIVFDQLGNHFVSGGMDAMLTGRPVIGNGRPEVFTKLVGQPLPICQANCVDDVVKWLEVLVDNPELRRSIGVNSRAYILKHINSVDTSRQIIKHLEGKLT